MENLTLGIIEAKFADIIWENEPLSSGALAKMAETALGWKKTTAFTVLKRLCEKGLFRNEKGTVSSLIPKADFYARQSERFVEESFGGSLPAFLAAFTRGKKLRPDEMEALRKMVDAFGEE